MLAGVAGAFYAPYITYIDSTLFTTQVPLDPRQEQQYDWGMKYLLEHVDADNVIPMHFWGQPDVIDRLLAEPYMNGYAARIRQLKNRGQYTEIL